jgi:hypothetical protein
LGMLKFIRLISRSYTLWSLALVKVYS